MRSRVLYLATCLFSLSFLFGCAADSVEIIDAPAQKTLPIVNGSVYAGDPAVGIITAGGSLCTATLVGQRTVLTAGHCIQQGRQHVFIAGNEYWPAVRTIVHPGYKPPSTDNDVALAILRDAPPITPAFISTRPPQVGQQLKLIGFGQTSSSSQGQPAKRIAANTVAYLSQMRIVINGTTSSTGNLCFGDSGGPTFTTINGNYVQVGVHSTISGQCGQQGHDMRVDVFKDWIVQNADGDVSIDNQTTPSLDSKPPVVKITSPKTGDTVAHKFYVEANIQDDQGVASAELLVDGQSRGKLTAQPWRFDVELAPGAHTLVVAGFDKAGNKGQGAAKVVVLAPLEFGEACELSDQCASGICARHGSLTHGYCSELCDASTACPGQASCLPAGPSTEACGPPPSALQNGGGDQQQSGGCAVGGDGASRTLPLLMLLLCGLLLVRRRVVRRGRAGKTR
ncbi:MAG: trypsin-like serine protease [Myxococcales bacterium]|nr:trypsin-like serine protease [Myxococcales bacterium]